MASEFQKKKFEYFFSLLDLNRNGLIELNDFSDMAELVRMKLGYELGTKKHEQIANKATRFFHHLLEDIEPEDPQSIKLEEWTSHFTNLFGGKYDDDSLTTYQELIFQYFFDFFDHNHDGFIGKDEYQFFFEIFGADQAHLDQSFGQLDSNSDGKISRYEMLAAIEDFLISDDKSSPGNWTFGNWEVMPS